MGSCVRFDRAPAPLREALEAQAEALGMSVGDCERGVVVVYVDSDESWGEVIEIALQRPTVVVLPKPDMDQYVHALAAGAGVVALDTPTAVMMDVVLAAVRGEALVPMVVTQALAKHLPPTQSDVAALPLSPLEERLAQDLAAGATITELSSQLNYSDRTVRRKLQGLYLKLGVSNRIEAVELLSRGRTAEGAR